MWCGKDPWTGFFVANTINPCLFNPLASLAMFLIATHQTYAQTSYIHSLHRLGTHRSYLWSIPGSKTPHRLQALNSITLALLHLLVLISLFGTSHNAPYLVFSELILTISWSGISYILLLSLKYDASLQIAPFAWTACTAYALSMYSELQFYLHGMGISPTERKIRLGLSIIMAIDVLSFFLAELQKPRQSQAAVSTLHDALLSLEDGQTGNLEAAGTLAVSSKGGGSDGSGGGGGRRRQRSWVSLIAIAAQYMWPTGFWLQVRASFCVFLIVILRLLNLAVPITYKKVIDEFSKLTADMHPNSGHDRSFFFSLFNIHAHLVDVPMDAGDKGIPFGEAFFPWVATWLLLVFLQGGTGGGSVGLLSNLRSYLWIPIGQNSFRRASLDIFTHVLAMDTQFHLHRRTGELLRIMDRGTGSIQTLLSTVVFQIGPAMFDIAAASIFLALKLKAWIAVIVFVTLGLYIPMTIVLTEWRGQFRRELNRLDNARGARATDALLNYETVKIFGNEGVEEQQYARAIDEYQHMDFKLSASMNALNIAQSLVIFIGLAAGIVVCTAGVADGSLTVGDAVLFVTLMQQLYAPLNFFGTYYRMIQTSMLDMEGIFDLLATNPGIKDDPQATPLIGSTYQISFNQVSFQYAPQSQLVLRSVSFTAPGGGTTALVGATGSGKSSILRLLLRFYDPTAGAVCIDDQNIRFVTQASLRKAIGVVPQDTVLFNDTLKYNIAYGRPSARDEEIESAAEGACLHETIHSRFPLGYDTLVGERGLRLSGGEKQRVAFARALLRNPPVLVLDEATSALDSLTERRIQHTLAATRQGRTVVVVAHRLSTIMEADRIVVMKDGEIVEMGTHEELLQRGDGVYLEMWTRQSESGDGNSSMNTIAVKTE